LRILHSSFWEGGKDQRGGGGGGKRKEKKGVHTTLEQFPTFDYQGGERPEKEEEERGGKCPFTVAF